MVAEETKQDEGRKSRVLLTSWAAVATALFLFTLIFGVVYVVNIQQTCDENVVDKPDKEVNLKIKDGDKEQKEDIQENNRKHTDFIIKKTSDGDIELLAGVNYNKKVSTVYLPREDVCVLSTGEDMTWYEDTPDSKNTTLDVAAGKDDNEVYTVNMKNKVTDLTLLTSEMQIFCRGKAMYWADVGEKEDVLEQDGAVAGRQKRRYCYKCYWHYWRCRRCVPWYCYYTYCRRVVCTYLYCG